MVMKKYLHAKGFWIFIGVIFVCFSLFINTTNTVQALTPVEQTKENIINEAVKHLWKPYGWGSAGPDTFDCSGFVNYVFSTVGFSGFDRSDVYHGLTSRDQYNLRVNLIDVSNIETGDLIFLKDPANGDRIYHVGFYLDIDETIESGGLEHIVNKKTLSRWLSPAYFAGVGRIKAQYWPTGVIPVIPPIIGPLPPPPPPTPPMTGEHSFGGMVTSVFNCSCTGNSLLTIDNLSTEGPSPINLIYQPGGSVVYDNNKIPVSGVWLNGTWENKGDSCVSHVPVSCGVDGLSTCLVCSGWQYSDGTITFTGTSN